MIVFTNYCAHLVSLIDRIQKRLSFPVPFDTIERSLNFMKDVPCLVVTTADFYRPDIEKICEQLDKSKIYEIGNDEYAIEHPNLLTLLSYNQEE